jgi:hypothetical protein
MSAGYGRSSRVSWRTPPSVPSPHDSVQWVEVHSVYSHGPQGVGDVVGDAVGALVGEAVGYAVGYAVGVMVGEAVGYAVGYAVGEAVGDAVGYVVGTLVCGFSHGLHGVH